MTFYVCRVILAPKTFSKIKNNNSEVQSKLNRKYGMAEEISKCKLMCCSKKFVIFGCEHFLYFARRRRKLNLSSFYGAPEQELKERETE